MTTRRTVKKNLIGQEDILYGEGSVVQSRNGGNYNINKVRNIQPVNSIAERDALDVAKFPKCRLYSTDGTDPVDYEYINSAWTKVGGNVTKERETLAEVVADVAMFSVGDLINYDERIAGNGGGGQVRCIDATTAPGNAPNDFDIVTGDAAISFQLVVGDVVSLKQLGAVVDGVVDESSLISFVEASAYEDIELHGTISAPSITALSKRYFGNGLIKLGSGKRLIVGALSSKVTNFSTPNADTSEQKASGVWFLDGGEGIEEFPDGNIHNLIAGGARKGLYRSKYKSNASLSVSLGAKHTVEGLATQFLGISKHALRPDIVSYTYIHATGVLAYNYSSYYFRQEDLKVYWPSKTDANLKVLGVDYTVVDGLPKSDPPLYDSNFAPQDSGYLSAVINLINQPANGADLIIDTLGCSHVGAIGGADQHFWGNYQGHAGGLSVIYSADATRSGGVGGFQHVITGSHSAALSGREVTLSGDYSANLAGREISVVGDYSFGSGYFTVVSADYSSAHGLYSNCSASYGEAYGHRANAYAHGMKAHSAKAFSKNGDNQLSVVSYSRRVVSVSGAPVDMFLDGSVETLAIPDNSVVTVWGFITAAQDGGTDSAQYKFEGFAKMFAGVATGTITVSVLNEDDALSDATVTINATGTIIMRSTTPAGKTYNWGGTLYLREVGV